MKADELKEEVAKILNQAPESRKLLVENYNNFIQVADYCCQNYIQSGDDTSKALEETKSLTAQSLASIAYQISTLATSVLNLLDAQSQQLGHMESAINLIGQTVKMHREKVSRREIGIFTAVRRLPRGPKISAPAVPREPCPPYSRRPISYQQLDGLGHGVKLTGKAGEGGGTIRKPGSSIRSSRAAAEGLKCAVAHSGGSSTFGKAVAPPTVPSLPESDVITTLLGNATPPPEDLSEISVAAPHPIDSAETMAPPPLPDSSEMPVAPPLPLDSAMPLTPPPPPLPPSVTPPTTIVLPLTPPPCLETVLEESSLPPPSPPPPDHDHTFPLPFTEEPELPAPPSPTQELDGGEAARPPPTRSVSLRVRSGPASRRHSRCLFPPARLATRLPVLIPPPPSYPAPPQPSSSSCAGLGLPAHLEHLDLELPALPPPPPLNDDTTVEELGGAPPHYLEKVMALYRYEATEPGELSMEEGDVIYVTDRHDDGWYEGILRDRQGFFPENYVRSCGRAPPL
ncbi:abl interactor 1-like isoform X2 [Hippocampus zosterae]|uniref:abl interactor 1-like isoform X2 n=1 Tax=Hippocampus zosterae TaxID=109293 RepID=UPI00223D725B|nr:abl interactor 1-like isoform X2 [Hippocampus zosterae]